MKLSIAALIVILLAALGWLLTSNVAQPNSRSGQRPHPEAVDRLQELVDPNTTDLDLATPHGASRLMIEDHSRLDGPMSDDGHGDLLAKSRTWTLELAVVEEDEVSPVAHLEVQILRMDGSDSHRMTTDADGRFVAHGLQHARYRVTPTNPALGWLAPGRVDYIVGSSSRTLQMTLHRPTHGLVVEVVDGSGSPAPKAHVSFPHSIHETPGGLPMLTASTGITDVDGRTELQLFAPAGISAGMLFAVRENEASGVVLIESVDDVGVPRLTLLPAANVSVEVRDADGTVVVGHAVRATGTPIPRTSLDLWTSARDATTDESGIAWLGPLIPGPTFVEVDHPQAGYPHREEVFPPLAPGETRRIRIDLPRGCLELAVAGQVLDEGGRPIEGVPLRVEELAFDEIETGAEGRFELWSHPIPTVTLTAGTGPDEAAYEPARTTVPFGTRDIALRRVAIPELRTFQIRATDIDTGRPIDALFASFDRGRGTERWLSGHAPREVYTRGVLPGMRVHVNARGYEGVTLDLERALGSKGSGSQTIEVALRRGLRAEVQVLDLDSAEPVPAVRFESPEGDVFESDAEGHGTIVTTSWTTFRVTRAGYVTDVWNPDVHVLFPRGVLWLAREP